MAIEVVSKENKLLKLAREAIRLFREAENHHLEHRCSFQCDMWFRIQNKACLKAMDFEVLVDKDKISDAD